MPALGESERNFPTLQKMSSSLLLLLPLSSFLLPPQLPDVFPGRRKEEERRKGMKNIFLPLLSLFSSFSDGKNKAIGI